MHILRADTQQEIGGQGKTFGRRETQRALFDEHRTVLPRGLKQVDPGCADQLCHEGGGRSVVDVVRCPHLDDLPEIQHGDAIRHGERLDLIVGHEQRGASPGLLQVLQFGT